ncbi:ATP-dependent Clp protease proteolytic subunit [Bradyrhizobium sp. JYMT SZCCT0428]|uniref:ATP-dependent Clp protease proteolytic subunit n=1 Tax=Bradyrhizobium sp. JYMT SZCCT0428 TaxID=2807673 RepID=UPI001BAD7AE9|nr:ATP-dependent Clp protease proteolytic subunit [Bradyrhizobium sp. JYMT SZCCT0428]MBR1149340.1 ATP-dependent Clp protease proteolytic subunit [Bradyrhizobium sp. JYMT SZCCT0428]
MILELTLKGAVGPDKPISVRAIREKLDTAGSYSALSIDIISTGGSSEEGFAIYTLLRALPVPIVATATAECFSSALLVYMAAGLRRAKAGAEFLLHPTHRDRGELPEQVTADVLRAYADGLARIDARTVDIFADRTGYSKSFLETEKGTEDTLGCAAAIETGIVHEFEGLTPACDPGWPDAAQRMLKETRNLFLPTYMTSKNYYEACRVSAFFEVKKTEKVDLAAPSVFTTSYRC